MSETQYRFDNAIEHMAHDDEDIRVLENELDEVYAAAEKWNEVSKNLGKWWNECHDNEDENLLDDLEVFMKKNERSELPVVLSELGHVYDQAAKADKYEAKARLADELISKLRDSSYYVNQGTKSLMISMCLTAIKKYESGGSDVN